MAVNRLTALLVAAALGNLSGCLSPPDAYYGAYTASCRPGGDLRASLVNIARSTASKLSLPLKIDVGRTDSTRAIVDLPSIPGATPYRENSSGQIVFSWTPSLSPGELGVVIIGSLKKDKPLVENIRVVVEEQLKSHGCAPWTFDGVRTVYF
jgi:hypothetical protein